MLHLLSLSLFFDILFSIAVVFYQVCHYFSQGDFVAAFAQSNEGDVSPNTKGPHCLDTGLPCDFNHSTCNGKVCIYLVYKEQSATLYQEYIIKDMRVSNVPIHSFECVRRVLRLECK